MAPTCPLIAESLKHLGSVLRRLGDVGGADNCLERASNIERSFSGREQAVSQAARPMRRTIQQVIESLWT